MSNRNDINNGNYNQGNYNPRGYNQGNMGNYNENHPHVNMINNNYNQGNYSETDVKQGNYNEVDLDQRNDNQGSYSETNTNQGNYIQNIYNENNSGVIKNQGNKYENSKITSKEKNIAIAGGIVGVVIVLAIIAIALGGGSKNNAVNEDGKQRYEVDKLGGSEDDLFNEIKNQEGYEEDEKGSIENEEGEYNEGNSEENEGEQNQTVDPQQLPNPDYDRDERPKREEESEQDTHSQQVTAPFQPKRYMINTNSKKEIIIKLKGTVKTKVKGVYRYQEKNGEVKTRDWDKTLNDRGEDTLRIRIPHKPEKIELQILSAESRDGRTNADCIMESYEAK